MIRFLSGKQESQAEKELKVLLLDEGTHVISTFELNRIASLTYGDLVCDEIFEIIELVVSRPMNFTTLALHKTLVVTKHILIYGSAKCVNSGYGIGKFIEGLTNYNTILLAQQRQGPRAFLQRLQGGGVDKGEPIREVATEILGYLNNINQLQRIRNESASKNSLVPVGGNDIGFITDEVRHHILKKKMEEQQQVQITSNLAKSRGGFGGGYNARDGKSVVGAAHGIEEMVKMANKQKKHFSDDGKPAHETTEERILKELMAEAQVAKKDAEAAKKADEARILAEKQKVQVIGDLLDFGGPATTTVPTVTSTTNDLLGSQDLLGVFAAPAYGASTAVANDPFNTGNLLGSLTTTAPTTSTFNDPFGGSLLNMTPALGLATDGGSAQKNDVLEAYTGTSVLPDGSAMLHHTVLSATSQPVMSDLGSMMETVKVEERAPNKAVMASNGDRFAALDALASKEENTSRVTTLDMKNAENRILGFVGNSVGPLDSANSPPSLSSPATTDAMPIKPPPLPAEPMIQPVTGQIATTYGVGNVDDEENPWVMGGTAGSGLGDPIAPAPGAPPPPLP
jgi:hypothetical protein